LKSWASSGTKASSASDQSLRINDEKALVHFDSHKITCVAMELQRDQRGITIRRRCRARLTTSIRRCQDYSADRPIVSKPEVYSFKGIGK
jgi:hypothetical protein